MQEIFDQLLSRVKTLPGIENVSGFARSIGMNQKTVDLYLKGERKPSLEFVLSICSSLGVSADWLLGLSDSKMIQPSGTNAPISQAKLEGLKAAIRSLLDQY